MSGLEGIPIQVQNLPSVAGGGYSQALFAELENALQGLLDSGREHSIDLRSLPLAPGELESLKEALGRGEVTVEVNALGKSDVQETAYRGIWWVTHHNAVDEVMAEFIEVSFCPDIIRAQRDDVRESLEALSDRLTGNEE
ncbi:MAG TPA: hydrogenase expression/formation C-terminal domain-containing protein [Gammaproteobacteria bacterium]|jgi:hydrogenase-1 operon protein HyaF|nr:hydrogenase expression/formation C-terminal domain-containing protein [Gammaproteobacteria bacterium]